MCSDGVPGTSEVFSYTDKEILLIYGPILDMFSDNSEIMSTERSQQLLCVCVCI